jgi:V/A-type H+-transporting ATPase subunit C
VTLIISRPFSTYVKFVYPNAKFEAIGNPFIGDKELTNIIESKDLDAFKESLNTLKDYDIVGEDTYSVQKSLDDNFLQTIEMMRKDSSKKLDNFYNTYLEKIDIYLIKNHIKKILLGKNNKVEIENVVLPSTKKLLDELQETDNENLLDLLVLYGFEKELAEAISEEKPDLLKIDIIIDRYIIKKFEQVKVPYRCEQAKQNFVKRMIDVLNIKNLLRAKQLGYDSDNSKKLFLVEGKEIALWKFNELAELEQVPQIISALEGTSYFNVLKDSIEEYDKEDSTQVLENALDSFLLKLVGGISLQNYLNLGPTIRFLVSKEFEIKNLKAVAKGVGERLPSNTIKSFLIMEAA